MLHIHPINAFSDNYIWCIHHDKTREAFVVDPGDASPVIKYLTEHNLKLTSILITHHHMDHTGGVAGLKKEYDCKVYGFTHSGLNMLDILVSEGDAIEVLDTQFRILEVPGHTLDHIAYFSPSCSSHEQPWLFCGDTLFSGGCGRLFEGTADMMYHSLAKLSTLPADSQVYCAHEYTLANLAFANSVTPDNPDLKTYTSACEAKRHDEEPTIPSTIQQELAINPFLKTHKTEVITAAQKLEPTTGTSPESVFATIRRAKDRF